MTDTIDFKKWMDEFIESITNNLGLKTEDLEVPFARSYSHSAKYFKTISKPIDPRREI